MNNFAVLVKGEFREQCRVALDGDLQCLDQFRKFKQFLVKLYHGKQVVHRGHRRVELIVKHIELFRGELVRNLHSLGVLLLIGFFALNATFRIQFCYVFCCTSSEDH